MKGRVHSALQCKRSVAVIRVQARKAESMRDVEFQDAVVFRDPGLLYSLSCARTPDSPLVFFCCACRILSPHPFHYCFNKDNNTQLILVTLSLFTTTIEGDDVLSVNGKGQAVTVKCVDHRCNF